MWIVIIIALILLLKSMMASHQAAAISTKTVYVSQACGSSGDCFYTGKTIAAGVSEPQLCLLRCDAKRPTLHCCHIVAHFPVDPPPIAIQTPVVKPVSSVGIRPVQYTNASTCAGHPISGIFVRPPRKVFAPQDPFRFSCNWYGGGKTFCAGSYCCTSGI